MRDFSCFSDGAVALAAGAAGGRGAGAALDRSLQAATASVYRVALSSRKELRISVTWTRGIAGAGAGSAAGAPAAGVTGLAVAVDDGSRALPLAAVGTPRRTTAPAPPAGAQHFLQKKRGTRSFATEAGTAVCIYWDTAEAKYQQPGSPEPSRDYHLAVVADGELALLLGGGEGARELGRRFAPAPRRALLSRREQVRGGTAAFPHSAAAARAQLVHTTRCRFRDDGAEHEVTVACRGEEWGAGGPSSRDGEVAVSVDGKKVVEARRVKWNFRGNRTAVLGDGAVVEVMWDVHDWWFAGASPGGGGAQFMVKARGAADGGRVWMDEEMASKGQPPAGFFLHLQCYRR
ncbi:hypothetical protein SETIT_2G132100v2 [Setaria italica]|nr:uncharacterized protein LOC101754795 [Setaria italica]RCV10729.1 hypothetical protein SETIT_2G132100v2 [Setaria italica]TKW31911.1 hypothetical protein SEVIR_2G137300v2 [Setaria viridis]